MKILLIATQDTGGAGKACVRQHLALLAAGQDSRLLLLQRSDASIPASYVFEQGLSASPWARLGRWCKARRYYRQRRKAVEHLPPTPEPFQFLGSPHAVEQHWLCEWAEVIHLHWVARFVHEPSFFKALRHKRIYWTLHDQLPFTGGYHYPLGFPVEAYRPILAQQLAAKAQALQGAQLSLVLLCEWMRKAVQAGSILANFPAALIPNSLDVELFRFRARASVREALGLPLAQPLILFAADTPHNPRKGFHLLLEAMPQLPSELGLMVLGPAEHLPQWPNLYAFGHVRDELLMSLLYCAADLFVIPSLEDNLPNTVVEALACGLPTLGFALGGLPDLVQPGDGVLLEEASAEALAQGIRTALAQNFDRQAIAQRAAARFAYARQAAALLAWYGAKG